MTYSEWINAHLTRKEPTKQSFRKLMEDTQEESRTQQHAHHCSCLVSDSTIQLTWNTLQMTGCHNKTTDQACSPFKTVLRKIRDRYQSYCAAYKTHTMTTHHGGAGHAGKDRDLNSHIEDTGNIDDNESTNSSETTIVFEDQRQMAISVTSLLTASQTCTYLQEKYTVYNNV